MRKISNRRKNEQTHYLQKRKEFIQKWKDNGWYSCLFSGEQLGSNPDLHHINGKIGSLLTDERYFSLAKRKWHNAWHDWPIKKLMEQEWWSGFLQRVKERCPLAYDDVIRQIENRIDKS